MEGQPRSLRQTFFSAESHRIVLEGAYEASSPERRADLDAAIEGYQTALRLISLASVFSPNESAEDLSTRDLPFLLVSFRLAELVQKTPTSTPRERLRVLEDSRSHHERFLHLLDSHALLTVAQAAQLAAYDEDPRGFATLPAVASAADAARRRDAKIAAFRAERELRARIDALTRRAALEREKRRKGRRRPGSNGQVEDGDAGGEGAGEDEDDDDEDEDPDADDETTREAHLARVTLSAHAALQALEGINREEEVLAQAPEPLAPTGTSVEEDERRRRQDEDSNGDHQASSSSRVDMPLRRLQSVLGGPLLDKGGRPLQPFTIVGSRAELARGVFRPGHNLPTMGIDEYLEEERRRGGIIEGGGEASGRAPEPDEDDVDKADAETYKARAWDEFKEANPRGSGNTLNRG